MPIQFVPGERNGNPRWFPQDRVEFPPEQWVDKVVAVGDVLSNTPTYGKWREELGEAILLVTTQASEVSHLALRRRRMEVSRYEGLLARFNMAETDSGVFVPNLSFVSTNYEGSSGPLRVGFPSAKPGQQNTSFAIAERVISARASGGEQIEREVVKDPDELIGSIAELVGWSIVDALVYKLDSQYPTFKLRTKLSETLKS